MVSFGHAVFVRLGPGIASLLTSSLGPAALFSAALLAEPSIVSLLGNVHELQGQSSCTAAWSVGVLVRWSPLAASASFFECAPHAGYGFPGNGVGAPSSARGATFINCGFWHASVAILWVTPRLPATQHGMY